VGTVPVGHGGGARQGYDRRIDLAVSAYSQHKDWRSGRPVPAPTRRTSSSGATRRRRPATLTSLYDNPKLFADYPFHADILQALQNASVRPKAPVYQVVSIDIFRTSSRRHRASSPAGTAASMAGQITNALQSEGASSMSTTTQAVTGTRPASRRGRRQATAVKRARKPSAG